MFVTEAPEFVNSFIDAMDDSLQQIEGVRGLTNWQKKWLAFCLMAILITNQICWKAFERLSLGTYRHAAISWMFRQSNICWQFLLIASVKVILKKYGITNVHLDLDDTDRMRAKITKAIYGAHKIKDKKTGGYFNGQSLIFLLLVSDKVIIPVAFEFYMPDPAITAWNKSEKELKKQGVPKKKRPPKPDKNPDYPTKQEIALDLLKLFQNHFPEIKVKSILADALYGTKDFLNQASAMFGGVQVISQLRRNQNLRINGHKISLEEYFDRIREKKMKIQVRGGKIVEVTVKSARVIVDCHGKKRLVIALKYQGETKYRYLVATDLSWLVHTVIEAYTLRWLIEVFFQDWKLYEGWGNMAKQPDREGSKRSLILSLLLDHTLLLHPQQIARIENKRPACTVGSLKELIKADCLFLFCEELLNSDNPHERLAYFAEQKDKIFKLVDSDKHLSHRQLNYIGPNVYMQNYLEMHSNSFV